jgi:hypothetical protein
MISLLMPRAVSSGESGKFSWFTMRLMVVTRSASPMLIGQ